MMALLSPPEWMLDFVRQWKQFFGLYNWTLRVRITDAPAGDIEADGGCSVDYNYRIATLEFKPEIQEDRYGQGVVLHEIYHVVLADLARLVQDYMLPEVPEAKRDLLTRLWEDALERTVDSSARAGVLRLEDLQAQELASVDWQATA